MHIEFKSKVQIKILLFYWYYQLSKKKTQLIKESIRNIKLSKKRYPQKTLFLMDENWVCPMALLGHPPYAALLVHPPWPTWWPLMHHCAPSPTCTPHLTLTLLCSTSHTHPCTSLVHSHTSFPILRPSPHFLPHLAAVTCLWAWVMQLPISFPTDLGCGKWSGSCVA